MTSTGRPLRADAVRNRAKILDAARTEIATRGSDVGMDEIAATAGVAVGTLYRHFPTKVDLVAAVIAEYTRQLTVAAESALEDARAGSSPWAVLVAFLREVIRVSAMNEAVKRAAGTGAPPSEDEARAAAALGELLEIGIAAGQVRPDLTVADIYVLVLAAPLDQPQEVRDRWEELMLPCLTATAAAIDLPVTQRR